MQLRRILVVLLLAAPVMAGESKDPSKNGPYAVGWHIAAVPDDKGATLQAALFYPAVEAREQAVPAKGDPWPVCVFSPGGVARSWQAYQDFGKRFASWGCVTLIVQFGDRPVNQRALQFAATRDWLEKRNGERDWILNGKLDVNTFLAGGHSRGGAAAVLAAAHATKWAGSLTVGGAPQPLPAKLATPTLVCGSPNDKLVKPLFEALEKPRWLAVVAGMDHFMNPGDKRAVVITYCTAWVGAQFLQIEEFKAWISGERGRKDLQDGVLAEFKVEE